MDDKTYLAHYGVLGMKWGIRRTASQLGHPIKSRRIKKQRKAALEKARKTRQQNIEYEKEKQNALKKGTATDILKYKGDLTNEQMQSAINRITLEQNLSRLQPQTVSKGKSFMNKLGSDILVPAATDVSKQVVKSGMVYLVNNKLLPKMGLGDDEYKTFTNNKKK